MEYTGPQEYWFWMGVEAAQASRLSAEDHPDLEQALNNATATASIEAYRWGLCLGAVTTKADFAPTIRPELKESVDKFVKEMIDELNKDFDVIPDIEGNC
jgi:hypothetical protein